jgi:esterase/lipase superfamily enzyme
VKKFPIFWAVACFVALIVSLPVRAAGEEVPKAFRIPVFYATDRNRVEKKRAGDKMVFGTERKYRGICKHDLFLGVAYCVIANVEHKPFSDLMKKEGWTVASRDKEGPDGIEPIEEPVYKDASAKFFDEIYSKAVGTPDDEIHMFVPGYMSTFESGLRSAARFVYYSERPMILYSWPSKGKFTQYFADEATIEWSQEHFNDILNKMNLLAYKTPPVYGRLYSHSMGGRLVLRATPYIKNTKSLREVAVICPDVDDGVVKHYATNYFDGKTNMLVRLYLSKRDFMLRISQVVHGGYGRLGEDRTVPLDTVLPKDAQRFVTDVPGASDKADGLNRRVLTIDFTDLDEGTLGHRIPVEVLAGLSQQGSPGGKLKLTLITSKSQPAGAANGDAKNGGTGDGGPPDGIVKICKPGWKGTPILGTLYRYRPRPYIWRTKDWSLK